MQKLTLALNLATFSGGFSLISAEGDTLIECQESEGYPWATFLIFRIKASLKQLGCGFSSLDKIVFTKGPGSFTGIRIGIAVARTLSQFLKIPTVEITTLQAWAAFSQQAAQENNYSYIQVVIDSKRPDLYTQQFCSQTLVPAGPLMTQYPHSINVPDNILFTGDGVVFLPAVPKKQVFSQTVLSPSILKNFQENLEGKDASFSPLYFNTPLK